MTDADRILAEADREIDRGRIALADLERHGPPVRIRDLCRITGFTKEKFYADIERGELQATEVKTGQTKVYLVEREEALRHLKAIRFAA